MAFHCRLKQKFPLVFKDVCFYSDVCDIMASCAFRLGARRFIQELFEEFDIKKVCHSQSLYSRNLHNLLDI